MRRLLQQNILIAVVFAGLLAAALLAVSGYGASIYNPFTIAAADPDEVAVPEVEEPVEEPAEARSYRASAEGYGGPLHVEVGLRNGEIVSVEVVEHSETPGLSDPALEQVPRRILEAQSVAVDGVSGATLTAEAIKAAVAAALEDAGF